MNLSRIASAVWDAAVLVAKHPGPYLEHFWTVTRKFCFGVIFIALIAAKCFHLYAHLTSLPLSVYLVWGCTFFLQDIFLIFLARGLTADIHWHIPRIVAALLTVACT